MSNNNVILETHDLSRHFGGLKAVEGVNLAIHAGHLHSIIGPNGAGKTTLFNLLSGALKPSRGRIFLRGQDITDFPPHRSAHLGLGRSYQITNIFPNLTVFENVRLAAQALGRDNFKLFAPAGRFKQYEEKAGQALAETGLLEAAVAPARNLPHGDKRRLELALLLAQELDIWLLDEPTAGLASEQVPAFMAVLDRMRKLANKTVVLVEHNMSVVMSLSDRISVMHQGQLLAEGAPAEIAANETVQKAYLGELYSDFGF
ncbi:MAG: ABC transporter ATP-binding protein [Chloroflexi bacterium]|nr:ABC transporter ATP-binding protein [Chloroflexota bacterium]